ncbi:hypothetical protein FOZ63_020674, partial [Perkinsus olseni]
MKPSPPDDVNPVTAKEAVEWAVALLRAAGLVEVGIAHFRCLRDSSAASATTAAARGEDILRSACRLAAGGGSPQDYLLGLGYPRLEQLGSAGPASDLEAMRAVLWMVFNEATGLRRRAESTWTPRLPRVIRLLLGLNPQPSRSGLTAVERPSARPSYPVGSDPIHAILQAASEVTRLDRESASIAAALTRVDYRSPATMASEKAVKILNPKIAGSLEQFGEEITKLVHLAACEVKFCDWLRSTTVYRAEGTAAPEVVVVQDGRGEQHLRVLEEEEADSLLEDCMCILSSPPFGLHFHKAGVRVKIVVSPLSVPQSAARRVSKVDDGEGRKTSLVSLPEKRVLQPSAVENIAEGVSSVSKKPCVRGGSDASLEGEDAAELRAEIGRLQERIAWMASAAGPEADSGLRLADMQEELRQERENCGKLKVKMERLERRVADSDRLQATLDAAKGEAEASREQVMALELRIASYEDHDRTLAALTKMNQELDQRATEAAKETEAVREAYEEKLASLEEELRDLRVSSEESDKGLRNELEGAAAESKQLAARLEEERRAHAEELERMEARMAKAREGSEETVRGLTVDLNHLQAQCEDMEARLMEKEEALLRVSLTRAEGKAAEALAEKESAMLLEVEAVKAILMEKAACLERSEADFAAIRAQLEAIKEDGETKEEGRKRRRTDTVGGRAGPVDCSAESMDESTATEGAEWALMVNASCNTTLPEERSLASTETEEGKWRAEVDRLTIALKKCRGRLTAARDEGDRLAALLEEGKERAEVFMKQREGERRGMQMMVDDLEEELRRYKYSLAEREATEVTALAEALLNDATGTAVTMAVAREMGKASEGLRMELEEMRTRWCEEERLRLCVEESKRRLAAALEETREEVVQVRRRCEDLKGALESMEQEREHIAMVKAEEAVAMNRLDEAVQRLEMERDEVEDKWAETEESMQREMEDMGEELAHWQGRAEEAERRLAEEAQKAEEAAAAAAGRHEEERQVYEKQLRDLVEQLSTLEASASDTTSGLLRELEAARLEGNDVSQCLINQRQGYERMMAEMAERVRQVEEKLAVAEATVEESRAELAAREEALTELIKEKEEAVKGLEEQLAICRGDAVTEVEELQRALTEERERHSEQAQ